MKYLPGALLFGLCLFINGMPNSLYAQQTGTITGIIVDQKTHHPMPGVNVWVERTNKGTSSDQTGTFTLKSVPVGPINLLFSFIGYKTLQQSVIVEAGKTKDLNISLTKKSVAMDGIQVTALRPDLNIDARLDESAIREANPRDSGELLRSVDGVDAVRRGPVGLDPVVRGLRETEVGTYVDETRIFPGGPARMDSPLSHLDPSTIKSISVVKGPYALTWGAGNMSAIRVETQSLDNLNGSFGGRLSSGYDTNFNSLEESASVYGNIRKLGYWLHSSWRRGSDYQSGDESSIPADFLSREVRGKLGYGISSNSYFRVAFGYQNQENIDYPGRLLNADFFNVYNASVHWKWNPKSSIIKSVKASAYINNVNHGMDNDNKPTAKPDPNRMPPFALDVKVKAHAHVSGGRIAVNFLSGDQWNWETGTDIYRANRDAIRTIRRRDNGNLMFTDLMWPDATVTDAGLFSRASHTFSDRLSATATLRLDLVEANADTSSDFYRENVSTDLNNNEKNLSGALTVNYIFLHNWTLGAGLGSVVRTADATERYSDRVPASKAQTSAEFVGNPTLKPERNTQVDLWMDATYSQWSVSLNAFTRHMGGFITIKPTDLPKRLPLSPNTVYQYINGSARFWGVEASATYRLLKRLQLKGSVHYLWGEDETLNEPALGIQPTGVDAGLRYDADRQPLFIEINAHFVDAQHRVASARGETVTDGYSTADLLAGFTLWKRWSVQLGIQNITDKQYVNHLNAKNPFTGQPIPEPGRIFFTDISFRF